MSPETYWKRRVFVLAGLLLVVALVAYGCNQFTGGEEQSASATPDAAEESPPESSVPPSPTPTDDESPSEDEDEDADDEGAEGGEDGDDGGGSDDGGGESSGEGGDSVPEPEKASDPCRPQDIVATAKTNKKDYAWDEKPKVTVTLVNTGDQTCTVDVGTSNMEVRITSGDDRVFSSSDCAKKGDKSDKRELSRGVPENVTVTWDRKRSWKDCRDRDATASSGTYVAKVHGDYTSGAERQVFRLN